MLMLSTAIVLFILVQLLAAATGSRRHLDRRFGRAFTAVHVLLTIFLGGLILAALRYAPAVGGYEPGTTGRNASSS